jgi:transposase
MARPNFFIKLTPEQTKELDTFLAGGYSEYGLRARIRAQVIWFSHKGETVEQLSRRCGKSKRSIWKWFKIYQQKGLEGLRGKYFYRRV